MIVRTRSPRHGPRAVAIPALLLVALLALLEPAALAQGSGVSGLGRIEPRGGVVRVAGPSLPAVVIAELLVQEGDAVEAGQLLATLDSRPRADAQVAVARAELENADRELARAKRLAAGRAASDAKRDTAEMAVKVARARLSAAQAEVELSQVRAPTAGQVLEVHARAGERVGPEGILELGDTAAMYAVAEIYETDIGRVKPGQRARISSPALSASLAGEVERIGLKIGKQDVLDADPVAKTDARVVEVEIRLDDGPDVSRLTNLQVRVEIGP